MISCISLFMVPINPPQPPSVIPSILPLPRSPPGFCPQVLMCRLALEKQGLCVPWAAQLLQKALGPHILCGFVWGGLGRGEERHKEVLGVGWNEMGFLCSWWMVPPVGFSPHVFFACVWSVPLHYASIHSSGWGWLWLPSPLWHMCCLAACFLRGGIHHALSAGMMVQRNK